MYRYTTPTIPVTINNLDFSTVDVFRVAIEKDNVSMLKEYSADDPKVDAANNTIYVDLTQEETAQFQEGHALLQVRFRYTSGKVQASPKAKVSIKDVLDEVVI